jgi:hypothetical protein
MKLLILSLVFAVLGFQQAALAADAPEGYACCGYIRSGHPGVNVTVDYGDVFASLHDAKADAMKRCRETNVGRNYGALCAVSCQSTN